MGLAKYQRLQLELGALDCGCRRDKTSLCPQHLQALPLRERLAYVARRRQHTQRTRGGDA